MKRADRTAALASFFKCSEVEADRLNGAMSLVTFGRRDTLIHQGDMGAKVWIVLDGWAQLQIIGTDGQIQLLAAHGPGELFGALPEERVVISDIVAQDRLSALEISTSKLTALMQEEARIGSGLSAILARQYNEALDRMASRITLTAKGRVYLELLNKAGEGGVVSPPPIVSALALTAQTTRETASRAISALERRGIIARDAQRLTVISKVLLEDLIV
ncbi:Crp/Fnr family transcriptional regulator [Sphingomonadaceae bacterium]|nr:Crp/Fnr family transcriptional regulator [Sphingomonadaceae bacterium]